MYDPDDVEQYDVPHHLDLRRDALAHAIEEPCGVADAFEEWERECIHEPERWHPRHVLALIRALKAARAELAVHLKHGVNPADEYFPP